MVDDDGFEVVVVMVVKVACGGCAWLVVIV